MSFVKVHVTTTLEDNKCDPLVPLARNNQPSMTVHLTSEFFFLYSVVVVPEILTKMSTDSTFAWHPATRKTEKQKAKIPTFKVSTKKSSNARTLLDINTGTCALFISMKSATEEVQFEAAIQKTNINGGNAIFAGKNPIFRLRFFVFAGRDFIEECPPFYYAQIPKGKSSDTAVDIEKQLNFLNIKQTENEPTADFKDRVYTTLNNQRAVNNALSNYFQQQVNELTSVDVSDDEQFVDFLEMEFGDVSAKGNPRKHDMAHDDTPMPKIARVDEPIVNMNIDYFLLADEFTDYVDPSTNVGVVDSDSSNGDQDLMSTGLQPFMSQAELDEYFVNE